MHAADALTALFLLEKHPHEPAKTLFSFGGGSGFTAFSYNHIELRQALAATGDATESWTLHDIRRALRSEMGELGIEPWIGEQVLNHARAGIEGTYSWAKLERQKRQGKRQGCGPTGCAQ